MVTTQPVLVLHRGYVAEYPKLLCPLLRRGVFKRIPIGHRVILDRFLCPYPARTKTALIGLEDGGEGRQAQGSLTGAGCAHCPNRPLAKIPALTAARSGTDVRGRTT